MTDPTYKTLAFFNMMVSMGSVCEKCGDKPSFPDGWYFAVTPETAGSPVVCPTCMKKTIEENK